MKPYPSCWAIENFLLVFYPNNTIRFCNANTDPFGGICTFDELGGDYAQIFAKGINKLKEVKNQFKKGDIPDACRKCRKLSEQEWKDGTPDSITSINVSHYTGCNLNCVYCRWIHESETTTTDSRLVLDAIRALKDAHYLAPDCTIAINGGHGEPSLHPDLSIIIEYGMANGLFVDIRSNAARYVELFAKACESGGGRLILSSDAGSAAVFKKIKQADGFDTAWANIQQYMRTTTKNVLVKYLIQPDNIHDTAEFIDCCVQNKVRIVMIDLVVGMDCAEDDIQKSVRSLQDLCKQNGIGCQKGFFMPEYFWQPATAQAQI